MMDLENSENYVIMSVVTFSDYYSGDKIREDYLKGNYGVNWEMGTG